MFPIFSLPYLADLQLPDFQRGWVWDDYRIRSLISSISNSFPVGAVMFLECGGDNLRFKYRNFTGVNDIGKPDKLVLDGQQRLTSIYCSLGSKDVVKTVTEKKIDINRFIANRAKAILDLISNAMGKVIANRDSEEIIAAFGKSLS